MRNSTTTLKNIKRYQMIEERMKKGIGVKRFDQESAKHYLDSL